MHEGHRDRMRKRITENGIDSLQPHEALEYMLYYAVPRKDTNVIAHDLISKYGSLGGVFAADYEDLLSVNGLTANAAHFITAMPQLIRYYERSLAAAKKRVNTKRDCKEHFRSYFLGQKTEKVYLLCLDADNNIINTVCLNEGIPAAVSLEVRTVVDCALKQKAASVLLAHNHPSGKVTPSHSDIETTKAIAVALELLHIRLFDHYIFSDTDVFSFADNGLVNIINKNVELFLKEGLKY